MISAAEFQRRNIRINRTGEDGLLFKIKEQAHCGDTFLLIIQNGEADLALPGWTAARLKKRRYPGL